MKIKINYWLAVWVILAAALALRLTALAVSNVIPSFQQFIFWGDASGYSQLAENLLQDGSYHFNGGAPTAFRMPGYPLILAVTYAAFATPVPAQLLQTVADLIVITCTLLISEHLFGKNVVSLLAMGLIALNPLLILSTVTLYPESLGILCTTAALLFLVRNRNTLLDGLLVGAVLGTAVYLKTNLLLVAICLVLIHGLRWFSIQGLRGFIKTVLPPFLVIGVMLLPWVVRNFVAMGDFIPTTTSNGDNFYRGNNPQADGGAISDFPDILPGMSEMESSKEFSRLAWAWIKANPLAFLRLLPIKAGRFVWPLALSSSGTFQVNSLVFSFTLLLVIFFYTLVGAGAWRLYRTNFRWELALLLAPFFSLLALSMVTYGGIRYSIPAQPGLAVLASAGLVYFLTRRKALQPDSVLT